MMRVEPYIFIFHKRKLCKTPLEFESRKYIYFGKKQLKSWWKWFSRSRNENILVFGI